MSVEYTVKLGPFSKANCKDIAESFAGMYRGIEFTTKDDGNYAFFFCRDSIRGFSLWREKPRVFTARMNHMSSPSDKDKFREFLLFLLSAFKASVLGEDGGKLKAGDITTKEIAKGEDGGKLLETILQVNDYLTLPLCDSAVVVYKNEYEAMKQDASFPENLLRILQERAKSVFFARRPSLFRLNESCLTFVIWDYNDMLLSRTDLIAAANPADADDVAFVAWEDFMRIENARCLAIPATKAGEASYLVYGLGGAGTYEAAAFFVRCKQLGQDVLRRKEAKARDEALQNK
ncbi:MAG: hypothetical protein LBC56_00125 [Oscillospiraceae bacterium]|jgi:hypothetical protein|nr:hypothetical protein [Oscillospiraceae bacterium]